MDSERATNRPPTDPERMSNEPWEQSLGLLNLSQNASKTFEYIADKRLRAINDDLSISSRRSIELIALAQEVTLKCSSTVSRMPW